MKPLKPDFLDPVQVSFVVFFFDALPLVVRFFALPKRYFHFHQISFGKINPVRHDGEPLFLHPAEQFS